MGAQELEIVKGLLAGAILVVALLTFESMIEDDMRAASKDNDE